MIEWTIWYQSSNNNLRAFHSHGQTNHHNSSIKDLTLTTITLLEGAVVVVEILYDDH
jgi:hypothetical protein